MFGTFTRSLTHSVPPTNFSQISHIPSWLHSGPQRYGLTAPYQSQASFATTHGPPGPTGWQTPTTLAGGYNQPNIHAQTALNRLGTPYTLDITHLTGTGGYVPPWQNRLGSQFTGPSGHHVLAYGPLTRLPGQPSHTPYVNPRFPPYTQSQPYSQSLTPSSPAPRSKPTSPASLPSTHISRIAMKWPRSGAMYPWLMPTLSTLRQNSVLPRRSFGDSIDDQIESKISIVEGNTLNCGTDMIVNPVQASRQAGTAENKIYELGGPALSSACRELDKFKWSTGQSCVTEAYQLPSSLIAHTFELTTATIDPNSNTPINHTERERLLRESYKSALVACRENGAKSIAIPLMSTGPSGGVSAGRSAQIAMEVVKTFLANDEIRSRMDRVVLLAPTGQCHILHTAAVNTSTAQRQQHHSFGGTYSGLSFQTPVTSSDPISSGWAQGSASSSMQHPSPSNWSRPYWSQQPQHHFAQMH